MINKAIKILEDNGYFFTAEEKKKFYIEYYSGVVCSFNSILTSNKGS